MIRKITDESYQPPISLYKNLPEAKATVNICASLIDTFINLGLNDIVDGLKPPWYENRLKKRQRFPEPCRVGP